MLAGHVLHEPVVALAAVRAEGAGELRLLAALEARVAQQVVLQRVLLAAVLAVEGRLGLAPAHGRLHVALEAVDDAVHVEQRAAADARVGVRATGREHRHGRGHALVDVGLHPAALDLLQPRRQRHRPHCNRDTA